MKKLLLILFVSTFVANAKALSILEAEKAGKITYELIGNEIYVHYETPLMFHITNISNENITIEIDAGTIVQSNVEKYQDFVLTGAIALELSPQGEDFFHINAMCIEQDDNAPTNDAYYFFTDRKNDNLIKLATFISDNKLFNSEAQFLVWDVIKNPKNYDNITAYKLDEKNNIWSVANNNGEENIALASKADVIEDNDQQNLLMVSGTFTFNLAFGKEVHLAMFNDRNVIVKELYAEATMPKGLSKIPYAFNSLDFPEDKYYIKLIMDGKVLNNKEIDMKYFRN
ncbi:MAG: hypothetical protein KDE33_11805 [Bacteroidetes bacterium]|nr:hypothetical protein [Bacteroidota bacterium]MCB9227131.1 hypothetical protein [Chitinophagales bacterium]